MSLGIDERQLGRDVYLPDDPTTALRVTPTGDLQLVEGRENVQSALRRRTVCSPGELLRRPAHGVGLLAHLETATCHAPRAQIANTTRRNYLRDARIAEARISAVLGLPGEDPPSTRVLTLTSDVTLTYDRSRITLQTSFEA